MYYHVLRQGKYIDGGFVMSRKTVSIILLILSVILLLIGGVFIFNESAQVPLWVPVGAFAISSWLSIIRWKIVRGGRS